MMQIAENWAVIVGNISGVSSSGDAVDVTVLRVETFGDLPMLVRAPPGDTVRIRLPAGTTPPAAGAVVRVRTRVARGGALFAHPDGIELEPQS